MPGRLEMASVQANQAFPGQTAEPGVEGERPAMSILGQFLRSLGKGFLQNVRGVDACLEAVVQAQGDHLPQPGAVALQQGAAGVFVPLGDLVQELVCVRALRGHE